LKHGAEEKELYKDLTNAGETILNAACCDYLEIIKFIDKKKSNFLVTKLDSLLERAAEGDAFNVLKYLFDLNLKNKQQIKESFFQFALRKNATKIVEYLIEERSSPRNNFRPTLSEQPTDIEETYEATNLKEKQYVDIFAKDSSGNTPLHIAAYSDALEVVTYLIEKQKFDINVQNKINQTPLHLAAKKNALSVMKFLMNQQNVDVNVVDKQGNTPLQLGASANASNVVQYLSESEKCEINDPNKINQIPLHLAARKVAIEIAKKLYEDENIEINSTDRYGYTPLHIAASANASNVGQCLSEAEHCDKKVLNEFKQTPLHLAVRGNDLVDQPNVDVNVEDKQENTPLQLGASANASNVGQYLSAVFLAFVMCAEEIFRILF
jgi:ankyrin repeat protein